jgi:CheY-like chemotaxis protein
MVDLNRVVAGMGTMLPQLIGEHIDVITRLAPALGSVWADVSQLEQVILNLSVNARDAMPKGGRLTIETRNVELSEGAGRRIDMDPGAYVMLAVSDTGAGMSREIMDHIFEPFFTTKEEGRGTGLGLSIVFGVVKQSRGSINVYSEPGEGTMFKTYLPRVQATARPLGRVVASQPEKGAPEGETTVLLVEDDDSVGKLAVTILERAGYKVLVARNAREAQVVFEDVAVDMLITDMGLPGMPGSELALKLVSLKPTLPVLFISGYSESSLNDYRNISSVFLEKPFTRESLLQKVRQALSSVIER